MLNKSGQRELAYLAKVNDITPIEGADNIELVHVLGWVCIAKKGEFQVGDLGVYFEIDSRLPQKEWSEFLAPKHYKVKTMKLGKFKVISQGLLLPISAFGWSFTPDGGVKLEDGSVLHEGDFLTKKLEVTYATEEDNKRKNDGPDKYQRLAQKMGKKFSKNPYRWLMKRNWGKKLLFLLFGHKVKKNSWPAGVPKTDEERIENMPWILKDKDTTWIATEKIDGSSSTFYLERKGKYLVCSRNVVFDTPDKACYYDTNIYHEISEKYNIKNKLKVLLQWHPKAKWVAIQGEIYGEKVQKRDYGLKERKLKVFNLRYSDIGRVGTLKMKEELSLLDIPTVSVLNDNYIFPDTIEEVRAYSHSEGSKEDGKIKEGIVFRTPDGERSLKCVDPEFLLKYHQ